MKKVHSAILCATALLAMASCASPVGGGQTTANSPGIEAQENVKPATVPPTPYDYATFGEGVPISRTDASTVVDSLNGVDALYTFASSDAEGADKTYSCAAFASRYFRTVYNGVTLNNLSPSCEPAVDKGRLNVVTSPQPGDLAFRNVYGYPHSAIVKGYDPVTRTVTFIEQNWTGSIWAYPATKTGFLGYKGSRNRTITLIKDSAGNLSNSYSYRFFRYTPPGPKYSMTATQKEQIAGLVTIVVGLDTQSADSAVAQFQRVLGPDLSKYGIKASTAPAADMALAKRALIALGNPNPSDADAFNYITALGTCFQETANAAIKNS